MAGGEGYVLLWARELGPAAAAAGSCQPLRVGLELAECRKPPGTGQAAGREQSCLRELLAQLRECLMFKRSET